MQVRYDAQGLMDRGLYIGKHASCVLNRSHRAAFHAPGVNSVI